MDDGHSKSSSKEPEPNLKAEAAPPKRPLSPYIFFSQEVTLNLLKIDLAKENAEEGTPEHEHEASDEACKSVMVPLVKRGETQLQEIV